MEEFKERDHSLDSPHVTHQALELGKPAASSTLNVVEDKPHELQRAVHQSTQDHIIDKFTPPTNYITQTNKVEQHHEVMESKETPHQLGDVSPLHSQLEETTRKPHPHEVTSYSAERLDLAQPQEDKVHSLGAVHLEGRTELGHFVSFSHEVVPRKDEGRTAELGTVERVAHQIEKRKAPHQEIAASQPSTTHLEGGGVQSSGSSRERQQHTSTRTLAYEFTFDWVDSHEYPYTAHK